MTDPGVVRRAIADAHRRERAFVPPRRCASPVTSTRPSECAQEAYVTALDSWLRQGVPTNPGAWLTTAARQRALNADRPGPELRAKAPTTRTRWTRGGPLHDDRLRLVFTCCHPRRRGRLRSRSPAPGVGLTTERDRTRVPGHRVDDGRPRDAGEEEDRRRHASRIADRTRLTSRTGSTPCLTVVHLLFTAGHIGTDRWTGSSGRDLVARASIWPGCFAFSCPTSGRLPGCSR